MPQPVDPADLPMAATQPTDASEAGPARPSETGWDRLRTAAQALQPSGAAAAAAGPHPDTPDGGRAAYERELARLRSDQDTPDVQRLRDELDDTRDLATRLAAAVEFVANLDRPLAAGGGTNERAALATLAADAHRAGLLPATGACNCESYKPCYGACCGPGACSCSLPQADTPQPGTVTHASGPGPDTPDRAVGAELGLDAIQARAVTAHPQQLRTAGAMLPDAPIRGTIRAAIEAACQLAKTDVPALVAEVRRLRVTLSLAEQERLWNRRAYEDAKAECDRLRGLVYPAAGRVLDAALAWRRVDGPLAFGDETAAAVSELRAAVDALDADQPTGPAPDEAPPLTSYAGIWTGYTACTCRSDNVHCPLHAEPAPELDSGSGWDRNYIQWMTDHLMTRTLSSGFQGSSADQARALLADRDRQTQVAANLFALAERRFVALEKASAERDAARAELAKTRAAAEGVRQQNIARVVGYEDELERLHGRLADSIDPATIPDQRAKNWTDWHPEAYCHRCGRPNIWSWHADSALWNEAEGDGSGILCPMCFVADYERVTGQRTTWRLAPHDLPDEAAHLVASEAAMRHELATARRDAAADTLELIRAEFAQSINDGDLDPEWWLMWMETLAYEIRAGTRPVPSSPQPASEEASDANQ